MPVSANEETRIKSFAGQYSNLVAGVPIKKRRFPSILSASPFPEEPCAPRQEMYLPQKEKSANSQGSNNSNSNTADAPIKKRRFPSILDSVSPMEEPSCTEQFDELQRKELSSTQQGSTVSTSSSGLYTKKNHASEEILGCSDVSDVNVVQSNLNQSTAKPEEPYVESVCHSAAAESKVKVITEKSCDEKLGSMIAGKEMVHLMIPKEDLALKIVTKIAEHPCKENCKMECPVIESGTDLALGLKEHFIPALVGQYIIDKDCLKQDKSEPVSFNLYLSKKDGNSVETEAEYSVGGSRIHSNRANWDLNTTMDAWEEPVTEAKANNPCVDALGTTNAALDIKPSLQLRENLGSSIFSKNQKHSECESRTPANPPKLNFEHCKDDGTSNLVSSSSFHLQQDSTTLSLKFKSSSVTSLTNMPSVAPFNATQQICHEGTVKPESFEGCGNQLHEPNSTSIAQSNSVNVKCELFEQANVDTLKSLDVSTLKLVDPKSIKPEPCHESYQESNSCKPTSLEKSCPMVKLMSLKEKTISADVKNCSYIDGSQDCEGRETCATVEKVPLETFMTSVGINRSESTDRRDYAVTEDEAEDEGANDTEMHNLKIMDEIAHDLHGVGEDSAIDDEKITCMSEDDSFDSEYESDGNDALASTLDIEQVGDNDDYEDGEVREPLVHTVKEDSVREVREVEHVENVNYNNEQIDTVGAPGLNKPTSFHAELSINKTGHPSTVTNIDCKNGIETTINQKAKLSTNEAVCLQKASANEKSVSDDVKKNVKDLQRKLLDLSERKVLCESLITGLSFDKSTRGCYENNGDCADETIKDYDTTHTDSILPETEANANGEEATKDTSGVGNQGRIINLSRASCASSPSRTRPISGRSLVSRAGRDLLSDALDGEKLHRGRDELYVDKFSREMHSDQSPRNSRMGFVHGRGRMTSRLEILHSEWDSDRDFGAGFYNDPSQFRGPRHKFASAANDVDIDYDNVAADGSFVSSGRLRRKPLNDEGTIMHHIASRRQSPGRRDVHSVQGIQIGRRIPRNTSPSRCLSRGDASELAGMRQSDKFLRNFADDAVDPIFPRSQTEFEGPDGHFTRGNRTFSSIQRRGITRIRSKSPIRSRMRYPCPWSSPRRSPRRRSPDGFDGHAELSQRRSPIYRVERLRSPSRPVFTGERMVRRHGSPSYLSRQSNEMRDVDSGRDHGHPRSVISSRSPSGRILLRNRRFDVVDPRDRTNNDEYFGPPVHSGRFVELNADGNGDARRRFGERRVPIRSFRPTYNGSVGGNLYLNTDDGHRPYRFVTHDDSDFQERDNIREREFDRRIKSRPRHAARRTRNMDEHESNYRHGRQVWTDDHFDDMSRVKSKRF